MYCTNIFQRVQIYLESEENTLYQPEQIWRCLSYLQLPSHPSFFHSSTFPFISGTPLPQEPLLSLLLLLLLLFGVFLFTPFCSFVLGSHISELLNLTFQLAIFEYFFSRVLLVSSIALFHSI